MNASTPAGRHYVFEPVRIRYDGLDADNHQLDLFAFGESVQGIARILAVAGNFAITQKFVKQFDALEVRVVAEAPEARCFEFWAGVQTAFQHPLMISAASGLFGALVPLTWAKLSGRQAEMKHLHAIAESLIRELGHKDQRQIDRLLATIERMAESLRPAARQAMAPVGRSCHTLTTGDPEKGALTLGIVDKEVIDAGPEAEITPEQHFEVVISELDMATGGCRLSLQEDPAKRYRGQVVDPVVMQPRNPYVTAMSKQEPLRVRAKALIDQGTIKKLFISDVSQ